MNQQLRVSNLCVGAAVLGASLTLASTSFAGNPMVPSFQPPVYHPDPGWYCPFAPDTNDLSWFSPPNVWATSTFSLTGVPDYRSYPYGDDIKAVATAVAILVRNYNYYMGLLGYVSLDYTVTGTWTSAMIAQQIADVNWWANHNAGGYSTGANDHLYNGLCNSRAFYLTCAGYSLPSNGSVCYSTNVFLPVIVNSQLAGAIKDGMVGLILTNVQTWDGAAWTYGEDHYYVVIGASGGGTSFKLFEPATQTSVWRTFTPTWLVQRWSNGNTANVNETVVNSTSTTREVVVRSYGLDAIW